MTDTFSGAVSVAFSWHGLACCDNPQPSRVVYEKLQNLDSSEMQPGRPGVTGASCAATREMGTDCALGTCSGVR